MRVVADPTRGRKVKRRKLAARDECQGNRSNPVMQVRKNARRNGVTLIELLCVIGIIAILVFLMLGPVTRAYKKARILAGDVTGSQ